MKKFILSIFLLLIPAGEMSAQTGSSGEGLSLWGLYPGERKILFHAATNENRKAARRLAENLEKLDTQGARIRYLKKEYDRAKSREDILNGLARMERDRKLVELPKLDKLTDKQLRALEIAEFKKEQFRQKLYNTRAETGVIASLFNYHARYYRYKKIPDVLILQDLKYRDKSDNKYYYLHGMSEKVVHLNYVDQDMMEEAIQEGIGSTSEDSEKKAKKVQKKPRKQRESMTI